MAFMFVSVTYYTIVKSSVPMWVLCFSVLLGLQRFSLSLGAVVLCIVVGIAARSKCLGSQRLTWPPTPS